MKRLDKKPEALDSPLEVPTPRTDALLKEYTVLFRSKTGRRVITKDESLAALCRQLERELAALGKDYEKLLKESSGELQAARSATRTIEDRQLEDNDEFLEAMNLLGAKDGETLLELAHRLSARAIVGAPSEDAKNAARYRWFKDNGVPCDGCDVGCGCKDFDAAIDREMEHSMNARTQQEKS